MKKAKPNKLTRRISILLTPEKFKQLSIKALNNGEKHTELARKFIDIGLEKAE